MRLGVLDVGSNTVHLLVVDARVGGAPVPAASHKVELRLAEYLREDETLGRPGVQALVAIVSQCQRIAEDTGCARVLAFATSALREAANSVEVLAEVHARTCLRLNVLSGPDEARFTFLAARRWLGWSAGRLMLLDIGGGSLELAAGADEEPAIAVSVPVGAGRMHRRHRLGERPEAAAVAGLRRHVRAEIGQVIGELISQAPFDRAVATSKTFRTLARLGGAAPAGEGPFVSRRLTLDTLREWIPRLAEMPIRERSQLPGVSIGRAAQLLAGAVVAEAAMELAGLAVVDICPWALREGIIVDFLDHLDPEKSPGVSPLEATGPGPRPVTTLSE